MKTKTFTMYMAPFEYFDASAKRWRSSFSSFDAATKQSLFSQIRRFGEKHYPTKQLRVTNFIRYAEKEDHFANVIIKK